MKIDLIGMILKNNAGRRCFNGVVLDDAGKPMSAADSLHTLIVEYARVANGGASELVTTSREVTLKPATTPQEVLEIGSPEAFAASDDPDCRQGGKACEGCLMVGWCLADFPPAVATDGGHEHACCGALENGDD